MLGAKEKYLNQIVPELQKNLGYSNSMQVPRIEKITLNMGVGEAMDDKKAIEKAQNDLEKIKKETAKINGLLQVIYNKLNEKKYQSDHLVTLRKLSNYYITTYDYSREIEYVSEIYDEDPNRIKNLRILIINSLNDRRMIEKIQNILDEI